MRIEPVDPAKREVNFGAVSRPLVFPFYSSWKAVTRAIPPVSFLAIRLRTRSEA